MGGDGSTPCGPAAGTAPAPIPDGARSELALARSWGGIGVGAGAVAGAAGRAGRRVVEIGAGRPAASVGVSAGPGAGRRTWRSRHKVQYRCLINPF